MAGPDVADPLRVVVVTTYDVDENVYAALLAGACGFLLKDVRPKLLVEAVHAAAKGGALVSPSVTVRLLTQFANGAGQDRGEPDVPLTARELDVVLAVARGRTNAEIATTLRISLSTVKSHQRDDGEQYRLDEEMPVPPQHDRFLSAAFDGIGHSTS